MAKRGAPFKNTNAARAPKFRAAIHAILSQLDDEAGVPDGTTHREIMRGYVLEAKEDSETRRDYIDRYYGKPKQELDVTAEITDRRVEELTDEELLAIVTAGRERDPDEAEGASGTH